MSLLKGNPVVDGSHGSSPAKATRPTRDRIGRQNAFEDVTTFQWDSSEQRLDWVIRSRVTPPKIHSRIRVWP